MLSPYFSSNMSFPSFTTSLTETPDKDNIAFQKAATFVCETDENIFLTGKAGSGKTTFLKFIRTQTRKKCAVVAPTGIAAINAGGETIHSFLQLPFGPFVPGNAGGFGTSPEHVSDKHSLLARLRFRDTKIQMLRKLELLIIDEVSMVRADLLDAMDTVLRHVRKKYDAPFGGVQVLFIGDLFQLPPVAREEDWDILRRFYPGTYFFDAQVIRQHPPLYIELEKVYRQKDTDFVELLNRVRTGHVSANDISTLNARYSTNDQEGYVMLCTHNHMADTINKQELEKLKTPLHTFEGKVTNDFNVKNVTVDQVLELKEGAQVMFVKNDTHTPRRYFNGKTGTIKSIDNEGIKVQFPQEPKSEPILVELEKWRNVQYLLDANNAISENEVGSFEQYPLKLAWAITVHKSQGLTLEKVIVDLSRSFAAGQVYVALSRCTSLEGLVLRSTINKDNVLVDSRVTDFSENKADNEELDERLAHSIRLSRLHQLTSTFSFNELIAATELHNGNLEKRKTGPVTENRELGEKVLASLKAAQKHAESFHRQLRQLFDVNNDELISERAKAASMYFTSQVLLPLVTDVDTLLKTMANNTKAVKQVKLWKSYKVLLEQTIKAISK